MTNGNVVTKGNAVTEGNTLTNGNAVPNSNVLLYILACMHGESHQLLCWQGMPVTQGTAQVLLLVIVVAPGLWLTVSPRVMT